MKDLSEGPTTDAAHCERLVAESLIDLDVLAAGEAGILVCRHGSIIGAGLRHPIAVASSRRTAGSIFPLEGTPRP